MLCQQRFVKKEKIFRFRGVKPYNTPERLVISINQAQAEEVCRAAFDLSQTPGAFVNECVSAVIKMMVSDSPVLPPIVIQYKALKSANALKTQLETKTAVAVAVGGGKKK